MATTKEAAKANVTAEYIQKGEALDYRNATDKTAEGTTTPAGYAAAPSEAGDKFVLVKLLG